MNHFFINKAYDYTFIIFAPLISLVCIFFQKYINLDTIVVWFLIQGLASTSTLYRGYLNPVILNKYWFRLFIVPIILFFVISLSWEILLFFIVIEIFYDIWHSSLQTWGIGYHYDYINNNGNLKIRSLDRILNLYIYAGSIIAGFNFLTIIGMSSVFELTNYLKPLYSFYQFFADHLSLVSLVIGLSGFLFLIYYLFEVNKLIKIGLYKPSKNKYLLYLNTMITCLICAFIENYAIVYIILNVFHSMHTFGISFYSEKNRILKKYKLKKNVIGYFLLIVVSVSFLGIFELSLDWSSEFVYDHNVFTSIEKINNFLDNAFIYTLFKIRIIASIMHYWVDSFIWGISH